MNQKTGTERPFKLYTYSPALRGFWYLEKTKLQEIHEIGTNSNIPNKGEFPLRYRHRFFDQVGHETMYATSGFKLFFTI